MWITPFSIFCALFLIFALTFWYSKTRVFKQKGINVKLLFFSLCIKLLGTFAFCYTYQDIYKGGDTLHYHEDAKNIAKHFWNDPNTFIKSWIFNVEANSQSTYYFKHYKKSYREETNPREMHLVRFIVPFEILSFGGFYACSLLISFLAFSSIWKIFEMLKQVFPSNQFTVVILFIPSILFWTGGILKDTIILFATGWIVYSTFRLIYCKKGIKRNMLMILFCLYLISSIKPYILVVLIPCLMLWFGLELIKRIGDKSFRILISPMISFLIIGLIFLILIGVKEILGVYGNYSELIEFSSIIREGYDKTLSENSLLLSESNHELSFNNILKVFFSINYQPLLGQHWNWFSLLASLENTILLCLTLFVVLFSIIKPRKTLKIIRHPFIAFCLIYSLLFSVGLGLSVSNFGAIIRLKSAYLFCYCIPLTILLSEFKIHRQ